MAAISNPLTNLSDNRRGLAKVDMGLIIATVILVLFGLMSLYSEGVRDRHATFNRQVINTFIGLVPFALMFGIRLRSWAKASGLLYLVTLALLGATLMLGKDTKGAQRWIDVGPLQFQPSELAKLLVVITLAAFFAHRRERIHEWSTFGLGLLHVGIPIALLLKQPHLGASLVVLGIWAAIALVAGTPIRHFATFLAVFVGLATAVMVIPSVREHLLQDYQRERIEGLLNKSKDVRGDNYQTDRAEIAFGVGGIYGTGYLNGKQKTGKFVPEQRNDFVFTVLGEEGGLIGCSIVLLAYAFFFYRVFMVMLRTGDDFARMLAAGIFTLLGLHTVINIGMVLQLLPVVGLWLPFMSAGGTAIWLCLACVGLLLNIRRETRDVLF
jgi:rod shape determining protein RodA